MSAVGHSPGCDLRHFCARTLREVCWQILLVGNFRRSHGRSGVCGGDRCRRRPRRPCACRSRPTAGARRGGDDPEAVSAEVARLGAPCGRAEHPLPAGAPARAVANGSGYPAALVPVAADTPETASPRTARAGMIERGHAGSGVEKSATPGKAEEQCGAGSCGPWGFWPTSSPCSIAPPSGCPGSTQPTGSTPARRSSRRSWCCRSSSTPAPRSRPGCCWTASAPGR